ncbi:MAG: Gfo/Idh/MocA family protein [Rhodospirillaceae bacterium]
MSATNPPNIGIIGAGRISQLIHITSFIAVGGSNLIAIADHQTERAKRVAKRYAIPKVYESHTELLQDSDIDAVIVAINRRDTTAVVRDALLAGKHVLSEKPMAYSIEEAASLQGIAAKNDLIYNIGYMKRHDSAVIRAREILFGQSSDSGLGDLLMARFYNFGGDSNKAYTYFRSDRPRHKVQNSTPELPSWVPENRASDYDQFMNVYSHDINLYRYLMGDDIKILSVRSQSDKFFVSATKEDRVQVYLDLSYMPFVDWHEGADFMFEKGKIALTFPSPVDYDGRVVLNKFTLDSTNTLQQESYYSDRWAFKVQAESFIHNILRKSPQVCSGESCLADYSLIEKIWKAAS